MFIHVVAVVIMLMLLLLLMLLMMMIPASIMVELTNSIVTSRWIFCREKCARALHSRFPSGLAGVRVGVANFNIVRDVVWGGKCGGGVMHLCSGAAPQPA